MNISKMMHDYEIKGNKYLTGSGNSQVICYMKDIPEITITHRIFLELKKPLTTAKPVAVLLGRLVSLLEQEINGINAWLIEEED